MSKTLDLRGVNAEQLRTHLLPTRHEVEEAAFVFARPKLAHDNLKLVAVDVDLLRLEDFDVQSAYHLALKSAARSRIFARAKELDCCLVEIHSHLGESAPMFSWSDIAGFRQWIPHVQLRLPGLPYAAVVVTRLGFDGFVWEGSTVSRLDSIADSNGEQIASRLSEITWPAGRIDYAV